MGLNLQHAQENKLFHFVDFASKIAMLPLISKENIPEPYYITILNFLYKSIIEALNAIDTDKSEKINSLGSVMIDDISVLLFYGCPSSLVMKFIFWLKRQIYQRNGCLIVLSHGDQPFEEDKECSSLTHSLLHSCEAWFRVSALPSGLSQDVHGQVIFEYAFLNFLFAYWQLGSARTFLFFDFILFLHRSLLFKPSRLLSTLGLNGL
ncbi:Elongator subunit elp6, variant 2 [Entomophthora muscae]|uniref:Elongator subunit elp6, variant 2 n=1 Tax=Entomophthora muscae TaxID=34485 RepID=A0ACC2USI4_9FUNG|nr:Elongator subunit elp6, variant 2 [Entomophthora muscae]